MRKKRLRNTEIAYSVRRSIKWNKNEILKLEHKPMFLEKEMTLLQPYSFPPTTCVTVATPVCQVVSTSCLCIQEP